MGHSVASQEIFFLYIVHRRAVMSFPVFISSCVKLSLLSFALVFVIMFCFGAPTTLKSTTSISTLVFILSKGLVTALSHLRVKIILYFSVGALDFKKHTFGSFIVWVQIWMILFCFVEICLLHFV